MSITNPQLKLQDLTKTLLEALDERSRDIVRRRFGIKTGEVETLESIGREYGITRERVRQIESQAKKSLSGLSDTLAPVTVIFKQLFSDHGGILADDHIVAVANEIFKEDLTSSHLSFYLEILSSYRHVSRDPNFNPHWRDPEIMSDNAIQVAEKARVILKEAGHPISEQKLVEQLLAVLPSASRAMSQRQLYAALMASKHVSHTPFGEWGLTDWPETNPRGVGDKAYAVLRRHNKPEHFTKITELINDASFDHKRANAQTVHNELIKDSRFVLVGRGLYGLAEWGYIPGTVADVLESLLSRAKQPLSRDELIEQVLAQRQVKKNTILLGLQNEKRFMKTAENRYMLRQGK